MNYHNGKVARNPDTFQCSTTRRMPSRCPDDQVHAMQMMELHAELDERLGTSGVTVCNTRLEGRDQSHPCVEVFSAKLCLRRPEEPQRSWGEPQVEHAVPTPEEDLEMDALTSDELQDQSTGLRFTSQATFLAKMVFCANTSAMQCISCGDDSIWNMSHTLLADSTSCE